MKLRVGKDASQNNNDPTTASSLPSLLSSYLSLIQQYLNMPSCLENAMFLAEQCVAQASTPISKDDDNEQDKAARQQLAGLQNDAVYWLAMCYYRAGQVKRAQQTLVSLVQQPQPEPESSDDTETSPSNSSSLSAAMYLLAVCYCELEEYAPAESVLLQSCRRGYQHYCSQQQQPLASMEEWIVATTPCPIPNGAVGLGLLGKLCALQQCHGRAKKYFKMSLQLDPFLWTSIKALCDLGCDVDEVDIANLLGTGTATTTQRHAPQVVEKEDAESTMMLETPVASSLPSAQQPFGTLQTPGLTPILPRQPLGTATLPPPAAPGKGKSETTITWNGTAATPSSSRVLARPSFQNGDGAGVVLHRAKEVVNRQYYPPPSPATSPAEHTVSGSSSLTPVTSVTQSMLYLRGLGRKQAAPEAPSLQPSTTTTTTTTPFQRTTLSDVGSSAGNQRAPPVSGTTTNVLSTTMQEDPSDEKATKEKANDSNKEKQSGRQESDDSAGGDGVQDILLLLSHLGVSYQHLSQYRCREALSVLSALPLTCVRSRTTAWVLQMQGRAYLDMNDFGNAERCLLAMRKQDPGCMDGIELLSTVYWQLKKEVELAHLAQRVVDYDRLSPQAWCVVGNCFSLQKDHETALVFFSRSLQLDPNFTYAHTLSGYEYMANEDFDAAIACFRQALKTDQRHYNAWYGLGAIYHRQEKFDLAEYHLQRASALHPTSSVLLCNLGMAQYANGLAYEALDTLSRAFELDPRNPQARFQRATIYVALHRPQQALTELEQVRDAAPREATVHFAMGKVYKRLGQPEMAMKCFLTAMDLDPKDNNLQLIKSAMDKLDEPDVEDEEEVAAF